MYDAQCAEIDDFITAYKTLEGLMPEWVDHFSRDFQVRWAILDAHDIQHGELCITCDRAQDHISVVALHRQRMFYRLDVVPAAERHPNPLGAHAVGLPPFVLGPHVHGWLECREYVRINGFGQLPFRRQIQGSVTGLSDALAWVAQDIGINVTAEQRVCEMPQKGLFD